MSSPTEDDAAAAPQVSRNKRGSVELTAPSESSAQAVGDPLQEHTRALLDLPRTLPTHGRHRQCAARLAELVQRAHSLHGRRSSRSL